MAKVTPPTLPQAFVSAIPSDTPTGGTYTVNAGCDLQIAMNVMAGADKDLNHEIVIQAGATFTQANGFNLPAKTGGNGTGWITIRSSAWGQMPAGTRVTRTQASLMPKLSATNNASALRANDGVGVRGYRLVGLELTAPASTNHYEIARFGWHLTNAFGHRETTTDLTNATQRISIERCYIHRATTTQLLHVGVVINSPDTRIVDCVIDGGQDGADAQGIHLYENQGPVLIQNNEVSATGQCIFSGGASVMPLNASIPQDVIIRQNRLLKEERWNPASPAYGGVSYGIKPCLEMKTGYRFLIEGNRSENSFSWSHWIFHASAEVLDPNNVEAVADVTCQHNLTTGGHGVMSCFGFGGILRRLKFYNNLSLNVQMTPIPTGVLANDFGAGFSLPSSHVVTSGTLSSTEDIWIDHCTALLTDRSTGMLGDGAKRVRIANCIGGYGNSGVSRYGDWGTQTDAKFEICAVDHDFRQIAMLDIIPPAGRTPGGAPGSSAGGLPPYTAANWTTNANLAAGQFLIPGTPAVAGVNDSTGVLDPASPLKAVGVDFDNVADGSDLGVNFTTLNAALGVEGATDTTAPTVPGTPTLVGSALSTSATITWAASTDAVGVAGYDIARDSVVVGTSTTTTFSDTGLTASTAYSYTVRARDAVPNLSAFSGALVVNTAAAPAGTPAPPDRMRGFGPTRGLGTTDKITLPLTATASSMTLVAWISRHGPGGGAAGRVFEKDFSLGLQSDGATTMRYVRRFAGSAAWTFPGPAADTQSLLILKQDASSASNTPVVKIDDALQTVTLLSGSSGTVASNSNPFVIGNSVGGNYWDGDIAKVAIYNFLTSDANDTALYEGTDPLTIGAGPAAYHVLDGTTGEPDAVTTTASTIVGTVVQQYDVSPPATVSLSVTAGDPTTGTDYQVTAATTGTVNRVEFFADGELVRTDTAAPYVLFAAAGGGVLGPGVHTIEALVFEDAGTVPSDTDTLAVTEPAANADTWATTEAWQRVPGAVEYRVYLDGVLDATILQPAVATEEPTHTATFAGEAGARLYKRWDIVAVFPGPVDARPLSFTRRYIVSAGSTVAVMPPAYSQQVSKVYTPA